LKLTVVLAVLTGTLVLACSTAAPAPAEPTPNIDATVEAKVAQERAVDATVAAKVSGTLSAPEAKAPSTTQAACKLTGGETVQSGWTGEDTGDNSCNSCFCTNGVLGCTKMACPAHQVNSDSKPTLAGVPTATVALAPTNEVIAAATSAPIKPNPELPLIIEYETYYIDEYRQCCEYIARITNPTENWYKFLMRERTTKLGAIESEKPDGYRLVHPYSSIEEYLGGQRWYDQEGIVAREVVLDVSPDSTDWTIYPPDGYSEIEHGELFKLYPPATIRDEPLLENISGTTLESVLALCPSPDHYPGFYDASGSELFNQLSLYHEFSFLNVRPGAKKYPDEYSVLYGWWINILYESCDWYIK